MDIHNITLAVAGNPNSGKTTIFNAITGERQHVGNYPGVTVEKKEGEVDHAGSHMLLVDLPGTYSLTPYSTEEIVARNFILDERPSVVVDIVDSSNLERNLYLSTQLLELGVPLVLAFNMDDLAAARGFRINTHKLNELLGVPIVRTIGHKRAGLSKLLDTCLEVAGGPEAAVARQRRPDYGSEIEPHVRQLVQFLREHCGITDHSRWIALKLLENDPLAPQQLRRQVGAGADAAVDLAARLRKHIESVCGDSCEIILAERRYGFISGACQEAVSRVVERRHETSDRIDGVLLNRFLALPVLAAMMYLVFQLTFTLGNPMVQALDAAKERLADWVGGVWPATFMVLLRSLAIDGIIQGVGAVLTFMPLVLLLYLAIAILEDSGYMARGAFVMDRMMHRMGLHGKSFIPMLIGFGCTVPAILATRILETRRDRLTTMMVLPLMSCGARLPVYVLMLGAFVPPKVVLGLWPTGTGADGSPTYLLAVTNQALILFSLYATGIAIAVVCTRIIRGTIFRGEATPFVMELPPYRMPPLKGLMVHMWERAWLYVQKAGTIILAIVIILWALKTWPQLPPERAAWYDAQRSLATQADSAPLQAAVADRLAGPVAGLDAAASQPAATTLPATDARAARDRIHALDLEQHREELAHSAVGRLGHFIAPVLAPCGFDWKFSTAVLGSFPAKEAFISQMGVIYAVPEHEEGGTTTLAARLSADYTPLQGLAMMLFMLIASPCAATLAATVRESGSWKWAALQWTYLTVLAWLVTAAFYQVGRLIVG